MKIYLCFVDNKELYSSYFEAISNDFDKINKIYLKNKNEEANYGNSYDYYIVEWINYDVNILNIFQNSLCFKITDIYLHDIKDHLWVV